MRSRPLRIALGVAVVLGLVLVLVRVVPASSGSDRLRPGAVADVVALLHHDQQGIVLAHQAGAQSPAASTRVRALALATSFARQSRVLEAVLDASDVPMRQRLVDTSRLVVDDENSSGCDLMPKDAVSRLAATAAVDFDDRFATLMDRHLVGGARLTTGLLDAGGLTVAQRAGLRRSQRALA